MLDNLTGSGAAVCRVVRMHWKRSTVKHAAGVTGRGVVLGEGKPESRTTRWYGGLSDGLRWGTLMSFRR
jgi:hypothetical protein